MISEEPQPKPRGEGNMKMGQTQDVQHFYQTKDPSMSKDVQIAERMKPH